MDLRGQGIDVADAVGAPPISILRSHHFSELANFKLPISVFFPEDILQSHVKLVFLIAAQPGCPEN